MDRAPATLSTGAFWQAEKPKRNQNWGILLFHAIAAQMGPWKSSEASLADELPQCSTEPIIAPLETEQCPLDSLAQMAPDLTQMGVSRNWCRTMGKFHGAGMQNVRPSVQSVYGESEL